MLWLALYALKNGVLWILMCLDTFPRDITLLQSMYHLEKGGNSDKERICFYEEIICSKSSAPLFMKEFIYQGNT